ncbi:hypothetical protein BLOT_014140 [Blomia tropicalis]|nr:hypothetical protein BLOT_014140 [Blomia tropicalis]
MLKDKSNSKYKSKEDCGDMNGNVIHDDIVAIHSYILFQSIIDYESKNSRLNNRSIPSPQANTINGAHISSRNGMCNRSNAILYTMSIKNDSFRMLRSKETYLHPQKT